MLSFALPFFRSFFIKLFNFFIASTLVSYGESLMQIICECATFTLWLCTIVVHFYIWLSSSFMLVWTFIFYNNGSMQIIRDDSWSISFSNLFCFNLLCKSWATSFTFKSTFTSCSRLQVHIYFLFCLIVFDFYPCCNDGGIILIIRELLQGYKLCS